MDSREFEKLVKKYVAEYFNEYVGATINCLIGQDDIFIVWSCKTLQNNKAIASGYLPQSLCMLFEVTYNGDKKEIYIDAYTKDNNVCIHI